MQVLLIISLALLVVYACLVLYYWQSWSSIPEFIPAEPSPQRISVIIPARNEENNIEALLDALQLQTLDPNLFEVIVVDDHSTDSTAAQVRKYEGVKLIQLYNDAINSYKKKAIETGIASATGELIITTDADCIPSPGWLKTISSYYHSKGSVFIAAPVVFACNSSFLEVFQAMDFMVLQGITGAVVHKGQMSMCNGANLAYQRQSFYEVNGFSGIDHIASGDDMLLMYKIQEKNPGKVHYLKSKEAIVSTHPMHTWKDFFNQRIRWASKASKYQDKRILPVLLFVYLLNLSLLAMLISFFWKPALGWWLLGLIAAKTLVELPLFVSVANFFNKKWAIRWFVLFQPIHIVYIVLSGLFGQFGKYEWKGRKVK